LSLPSADLSLPTAHLSGMARQNLLDSLNPDQAASVLMRLARADPVIAARAEAIARDLPVRSIAKISPILSAGISRP